MSRILKRKFEEVEACSSPSSSLREEVEACSSPCVSLREEVEVCSSPSSSLREEVEACSSPYSSLREEVEACSSPRSSLQEEVEACSSPCSSLREEGHEESCSESGDSRDSVNPSASRPFPPHSILKREKRPRTRRVRFHNVTVYYFSRRQGFTSVPSQGGSTLGMSNRHSWVRQYSLGEFALEQERLHRDMLREHLKEEKLNSIRLKLTKNGTMESEEANALTVDDVSDDDMDVDNTEVDEYFFLQPLTTKKRRSLLRSSGVKKLDVEEKHELRAIRVSREDCGCDCRVFCDPETCACSMAGIKCQVDRMSFPCGCSKEGCSNGAGRVEFNPIRVRTHFLHTIMKLELERSREQVAPANGYHGEDNGNSLGNGNPLVQSQHGLDYSLSDPVQQTAITHLQNPEEMDEPLDDEDEDDDEDEEDEDEEEDSSSVCSGLSDSSTQSLANSDSEEEDEDEEDEEEAEDFENGVTGPPVSLSDSAPLSSVLCYTEGSVAHDDHVNGTSCLLSSPAEYYQLKSSSAVSANMASSRPSQRYGEALSFQDTVSATNGNMPQVSPTNGNMPQVCATNGNMLQVSTTNGNMPQVSATNGNMLQVSTTNGNMPQVCATNGNMLQVSTTNGNMPQVSATNGNMLQVSATNGNMPQVSTTNGNMPQVSTTNGNMPQVSTTNGNMPQVSTTNGNMPQVSTTNGNMPQGAFSMAPDPYTDYPSQADEQYTARHHFSLTSGASVTPVTCCSPEQVTGVLSKAPPLQEPSSQTDFLNNNPPPGSHGSSGTCSPAQQPQEGPGVNGVSSEERSVLPEQCPEVAAV